MVSCFLCWNERDKRKWIFVFSAEMREIKENWFIRGFVEVSVTWWYILYWAIFCPYLFHMSRQPILSSILVLKINWWAKKKSKIRSFRQLMSCQKMPAIYKASPFALLLLKQQSIFKTKQRRKFEQKPEIIYNFNLAFKLESKLTAQVFF